MIKTFKPKGLRKFFDTGNLSGIQPGEKIMAIVCKRLFDAQFLQSE